VFMKLEAARAKLTDSRERPNGDLRVTTTPGIGVHWLTPRLGEFVELYPDIHLSLITTDEELDLAMRAADVAIRLRQPTQPDLIQRKLFSVRFHAYASPEYIKRFGTPRELDDLDRHRVLLLGGSTVPNYLENRKWLIEVARNGKGPRTPALTINNVLGLLRACQRGIGVALLPDYLVEENGGLVQLFGESDTIALDAYFVYPEELKSARAGERAVAFFGGQAASCSPLEGDCRPPRRQTVTGPVKGPVSFFAIGAVPRFEHGDGELMHNGSHRFPALFAKIACVETAGRLIYR